MSHVQYRGSDSSIIAAGRKAQYASRAPMPKANTKATKADDAIAPEWSVRLMQLPMTRGVLPFIGERGRIAPRIGYLIELLQLEFIELQTEQGSHLVILRNNHPNRARTEAGTLHHFFVPAQSTALYAVHGTVSGDPTTIEQSIIDDESTFQYVRPESELAAALDVDPQIFADLRDSYWSEPTKYATMRKWHEDLIVPSLNN